MRPAFAALFGAVLAAAPALAETMDGASFGEVHIVAPASAPMAYATLFSGPEGWGPDDDRALEALAREGVLAVGVDVRTYLANLAAHRNAVRPAECVDVFQDVEDLARRVQANHPSAFYNLPIVAGRGEGGALAYVALAQAPVATLSAALSLDPTDTVGVARALCRLDGFPLAAGGARRLSAVASLQGEWRVLFDARADEAGRQNVERLSQEGTPLTALSAPPGADMGVARLIESYLSDAERTGVGALPLVELPVPQPSRVLAVFVSGDGGWRDLDKTIGEKLQSLGVPVVGWDALRYFWRRKSPEQTTADLKAILDHYRAEWGAEKFALIGYSFGADVLPVLYNRLPEAERERVAMLSLMGLEPKADWEIRMVGWLGAPPSDEATPLAPEFAKIPGTLVQCFYGVEEQDPGCLTLDIPGAERVKTPGAHHFGYEYERIAVDIVEGLKRRRAFRGDETAAPSGSSVCNSVGINSLTVG